MVRFIDTRTGVGTGLTFSDVIIKGIAESGGLFVPDRLPVVSPAEVIALTPMSYAKRAAFIYKKLKLDIDDETIDEISSASYGSQFDDKRIACVETIDEHTHVLELWHGPTSAFKDMALQCMPRFFSAALEKKRAAGEQTDDMLILVATSGDTGKAALQGFADRERCKIAVLYPENGVSQIQRMQMVTQKGDNVAVYGVRGNFDDCQNTVKAVFNDKVFNEWLHEHKALRLSSANSINFGRLMPQIVYYFSAVADLLASGGLKEGELLDICVPTGNFGNILGAFYAKRMGAPIGRLICASNENKILTDFISTGTYDISHRSFIKTPSPSMDILISSNLERLLFHLADGERVARWMDELNEKKKFTVDKETFAEIRALLSADYVTNEESLETLSRIWKDHGYLCDPHTAVAWEVGERLRTPGAPLLIVSTAHWAKFATDVLRALSDIPAGQPLTGSCATHSEFEQLDDIVALARNAGPVPLGLANLVHAHERFSCSIDAGASSLENALEAL
ncbi:MAG: threonine synthase [Coriobacteriia bacterium]|nr:threonine synthase [Coriobacteriia bacterium]